ncbi:hypothetical protein ILUMI_01587 [Ignelater luminosus]|uniref:CHK kinase-like domain-containing protein n=1 Tax=Ignelater luminosus TaxID=2038154 RepID=A0A8K0GLK6_IGNLU|nr:hypothetical protein ILUMI_01587 [Ignelater luminosus]
MSDTISGNWYWSKEIKRLLAEIAGAEGFQDYKIENTDGSTRGDGYIGIMKTVKIIAKDNRVLNLIVKSASKSDALRSQVPIERIFKRETYLYDTVFVAFKTFETEKGLRPCHLVPKFYNSLSENKCEVIILENLKEIGYKLYERRIPMNEDHVRLVLTEYGRLHALSFALKDQDPKKFQNITGCMNDHFVEYMLQSGFLNNFIKPCIKAQDAFDKSKDKRILDAYKAFLETIRSFFEGLLKDIDEYSVILHGDCWTNNMMFKYEDTLNSTKPTEVCFFDFQISRLGSPVLDLLYFFYTCSPKEIINELDYYLQLYYNSFSDYLRKLGSDPDKILPYSVLQEHWKKYSRYGLAFSIFVIHIMLTEKDEAIDLSEECEAGRSVTEAFDYEIKKMDEFKERVRAIILHFVERKFI